MCRTCLEATESETDTFTLCHAFHFKLFILCSQPSLLWLQTPGTLGATVPGISATPYEDNLRYFNVVITGPEQSPYESEDLQLPFSSLSQNLVSFYML